MKFLHLVLLITVATIAQAAAQDGTKSFTFKKGEVMDIFLLSQTKNAEDLYERYKATAFPVAFEYSYQPQPGFKIGKLTLGTNKPGAFLFGKWGSLEKREGFLDNIVKRVPDFHQQRRELFPYFGLTYYEIGEDLKFSVTTSKFNVATSFWNHPEKKNTIFFQNWKARVERAGGKVLATFKNGTSPVGYAYNPNVLCIVEWQNESDFNAFAQKNPLSSYNELYNVHQFVIQ